MIEFMERDGICVVKLDPTHIHRKITDQESRCCVAESAGCRWSSGGCAQAEIRRQAAPVEHSDCGSCRRAASKRQQAQKRGDQQMNTGAHRRSRENQPYADLEKKGADSPGPVQI